MADRISASSPMVEAEGRAGVQPIEELLAARETLVRRVSTLRAVYGPFGTWEAQRKILLAGLRGRIRAEASQGKLVRKLTNDQIDDEAHDDPAYVQFITTATRERAQWIVMENDIEAINATINRGQAIVRFVSMEPRV